MLDYTTHTHTHEYVGLCNRQLCVFSQADGELTRIAAEFRDQDEAERLGDKGADLLAMMDEV